MINYTEKGIGLRKAIVLMESESDWQKLKLTRDEYVTALESI